MLGSRCVVMLGSVVMVGSACCDAGKMVLGSMWML